MEIISTEKKENENNDFNAYHYKDLFFRAIKEKNDNLAIKISESKMNTPSTSLFYDDNGNSTYYNIAKFGTQRIIEYFIDKGFFDNKISIEQFSKDYISHTLVERGMISTFKKLIGRTPEYVNIKNNNKESCIFKIENLSIEKTKKFIELFKEKNVDFHQINNFGISILHLLAKNEKNNDVFIELIEEKKLNCNQRDIMDYSPLDYAYDAGNVDLVYRVVDGQSKNRNTLNIYDFIETAIEFNDSTLLSTIFKHHNFEIFPDKDFVDKINEYAVHCVKNNHLEILREFLTIGNKTNATKTIRESFLEALKIMNVDAMKIIYQSTKGKITQHFTYKSGIFQNICASGNAKMFEIACNLFNFNKLNIYAKEGESVKNELVKYPPITLACKANSIKIVKKILELSKKEFLNIEPFVNNINPILSAIDNKNEKMIELLFDNNFCVSPKSFQKVIEKNEDNKSFVDFLRSKIFTNEKNIDRYFNEIKKDIKEEENIEKTEQSRVSRNLFNF